MTIQPNEYYCYLGQNYLPRPQFALDYVESLFRPAAAIPAGVSERFPDIMVRVVSELVQCPTADVIVPLTGGYDSRGLLGACLKVFDRNRITACTFGVPGCRDFDVASRLTRSLGVRHETLNTASLRWDLDQLEALAHLLSSRELHPRIETAYILRAMLARYPDNAVVMSGLVGDILSGTHSAASDETNDRETAIDRLLAMNDCAVVMSSEDTAKVRVLLHDYLDAVKERAIPLGKFTVYDVLELGFRSGNRVKSTWGLDPRVVYPFEYPAFVSYWTAQPFSERFEQGRYFRELKSGFPNTFPDWIPAKRRDLVGKFVSRVIAFARHRVSDKIRSLGDPTQNDSLAGVLKELCARADKMNLLPGHSMLDDHRRLMSRPTMDVWKRILTVSSLSMYVSGDKAGVGTKNTAHA